MAFQCLDPYVAVAQFKKLDGKKILKLYSKKRLNYDLASLKEKYGSENVYVLPCGSCESCRRNRAEDWAIRCQLESQMHEFNYFVTLTFDDDHIHFASDYDLRCFLDRLEGDKHKNKFKYFCCREFGEITNRRHYHLVLFCDFPIDLKNPKKLGNFYHYDSDLMSRIWTYGFYTISPFETSCARYVAKYTAKNSKLFMSRNIGKSYFLAHKEEIINNGFKVYGNFGGSYSSYVPHCFIRWFDEIDPSIAKDHVAYKKQIARLVMNEKRRRLVNEFEESVISNDQSRIKEKGNTKRIL